MNDFNYMILFLPLVFGLLGSILTLKIKKSGQYIAIISSIITGLVATSFFLLLMFSTFDSSPIMFMTLYHPLNNHDIVLTLQLDPLSVFMDFIASFLGLLIVLFSIEYMHGDDKLNRYYFFIQLFIISMMILVSAGDFLMMFVGWEMVGLCSFFLISHWFTKPGVEGEKCAKAGMKAFIYTRFGDIGFLTAIVFLYAKYGTLLFSELTKQSYDAETVTIIGLLFVLAAFGKSAQLPFMPWLSSPDNVDIDAMQGPTTVSALIHAATMVKAGIYLISRMFLIFPLGLSVLFGSWSIIVIIAGFTALIAGLSAVMSMDIKRILAYSTVSQLSYMFLTIGLAFTVENNIVLSTDAFYATQLHLLSHAFFKSLLFLCAGYIIHTYHSRNLNDLRGVLNWRTEKLVLISFVIGCLALVGIPPMNGFFSKEAIVGISYEIGFTDGALIGQIAFIFILLTAITTALYTGKLLYYLTFKENTYSSESSDEDKQHRSIFMPNVVGILAFFVILTSFFSFNISDYFSMNGFLPSQTFEIFKINDLILPILTLTIIVISLLLTVWMQKERKTILERSESIIGINILVNLSKNGFYFENIINHIWNKFNSITNRLKYIHTGDVNYTVLFMSFFSFLLIIAFLIGGI